MSRDKMPNITQTPGEVTYCPGRRDRQMRSFTPDCSIPCTYKHNPRPRALCFDCGAIVPVKKDGTLYKHQAYPQTGGGER